MSTKRARWVAVLRANGLLPPSPRELVVTSAVGMRASASSRRWRWEKLSAPALAPTITGARTDRK
jgi:hypothetical protein